MRALLLLAFVAALPTAIAKSTLAAERTVTLAVDNMTCTTCAPTVRKSIERVAGVAGVEISTERNTATVIFDDTVAKVEALIAATTNAGYPSRLAP